MDRIRELPAGEIRDGFGGGEDGEPVGKEDWSIILAYEHEVRRDMITRMSEGTPLPKALREAWADPIVRDRYLVTPLQRRGIAGKRSAPSAPGTGESKKAKARAKAAAQVAQVQTTAGRGKGKGKGKGANRGSGVNEWGCAVRTADGAPICFAFNNPKTGCQKSNCPFAHVCGVCFRKGEPMQTCKHAPLK